jgi:NTE family protein
MGLFAARKRLNLALQGGGAHGAFTWGVLDRLLEDDDIEVGWVSGTSAGAVNAVALAGGLASGPPGAARARRRASDRDSRTEARARLRRVWEGVEKAGVSDLMRLNPFLYGMSKAGSFANVGSLLSPYEFNPLGFDPLRKLLTQEIDFEAIRNATGGEILIAATDVGSGRPRLFRRSELTVEVVLASACLPQIHHAVEIEGRTYWDGGFSANPDILTLAGDSPTGDTLIVQLNPLERQSAPRTARDIAVHVSTITFSQPLVRDVETVVDAQAELSGGWPWRRRGRLARLARHRFHVVQGGRHTARLGAQSKTTPERAILAFLFEAGRREMSRWLEQHRAEIGRRQSADLRKLYLDREVEPQPLTQVHAPAAVEDDVYLAGTRP